MARKFNPSRVTVIPNTPNEFREYDEFYYVNTGYGKSDANRKLRLLHMKYGFAEKDFVLVKMKSPSIPRFLNPSGFKYQIYSRISVPRED